MPDQRDDQRENGRQVRTTSTTTSVECLSPGATHRRRISWNRSRSDVPTLRPDPTPHLVRNVHGYLEPQGVKPAHTRGSSDIEQDDLDHRLWDVSLGPHLSFHDTFGHDRSETRISGVSQPTASSSRVRLVSTENASGQRRSLSGIVSEEDPELGLSDSRFAEDLPMKKIGHSSESNAEDSYEQMNDLSYEPANQTRRRRTHKPYERGIARHPSVLRVVDGIDSAVRRSSTLKSAADLVKRVSRRVAPVRPDDSDDDSLRPLRLADNMDVDPDSSDESSTTAHSDSEARRLDRASRLSSPTGTLRRSSMTRTPSAGISVQTLPMSHQTGLETESPLKGDSLGIFGPRNKLRLALYEALKRPYTESIVLLLIVFHAGVLISQSAPRLHGPRDTTGYFHTWEDSALLAIFAFYSVEAMARIIVTGFIFDPQITLTEIPGVVESRKVSQPKVLLERLLSGRKRPDQSRLAGESHLRRAFSALRPSAAVHQQFRAQQRWRSENQEREKQSLHSLGNGHPNLPAGTVKLTNNTKLFNELPFEAALKRQVGMVTTGRPYLRHSWHRIDLLSIICFWISFALAMTGRETTDESHIFIFRAVATIRTARLLLITQGTATVLHSLKAAGGLLLQVSFFIGFVALLLAIAGVQSFSGSFNRSCQMYDPHGSHTIDLSKQCGGHIDPFTLEPVAWTLLNGENRFEPKGYICPLGQTCQVTKGNPEGLGTFDNIFQALLQVTIIASSNRWSPIMYQLQDSDYYSSGIFVLVALILLNFWLVSLLVAAVVKVFQSIRAAGKSGFGWHGKVTRAKQYAVVATNRAKWIEWFHRSEPLWLLLIFGSILVQAQKDHTRSRNDITILDNVERGITVLLDLEIIGRLLTYGRDWSLFFESGRNPFDAFLAVVTTILTVPYLQKTPVYPWMTIFLLMRWYRIILAIPPLRPLIGNVFKHFAEITNTVVFLLLMTGSASLASVQMLRGDIDPESTQLSFDSILSSFYAMYQLMLLENWTTVLGDAITAGRDYKQTIVLCLLVIGWAVLSNFILIQLLVAVINEAFDLSEREKLDLQKQRVEERKKPLILHKTWFERLNPYRLQAPQPRSVVNPRGINDANLSTINSHASENLRNIWRCLVEYTNRLLHLPADRPVGSQRSGNNSHPVQDAGLKRLLRRDPELAVDIAEESLRVRRKIQAEFILDHPGYDVSLFVFRQGNVVRDFCQACVPSLYEQRLFGRQPDRRRYLLQAAVFAAIVASIATAAITTPAYRQEYYSENGLVRTSWFMITQLTIAGVFLSELGIKVVADGWFFTPNGYMRSFWNIFDFVLIAIFVGVSVEELIVFAAMGRTARVLTALRALRLITMSRHMRNAFYKILYGSALGLLAASTIMGLYLVPFAIWGRNLFSGRLYSCNDSTAKGKADCYGEFLSMPVDGSLGFLAPRIWTNPNPAGSEWSFDDFRSSLLILFESVSLEGWTDVLASLMNISEEDAQPKLNEQPLNGLFLILFILFGSILIGSSFISILITAYSKNNGTAYLTNAQEDWRALQNFLGQQNPPIRPGDRKGFRAWCATRAINKHGWWARCTTTIYVAHILVLLLQDERDQIISGELSNWLFFAIGFLLLLDVGARLYGLGLKVFVRSWVSIFDVVVLVGMQATTIPLLAHSESEWKVSWANFQLQKLIQRNDGLNLLFRTSIASLTAIGKILCLWAILFATFALAYVQAFGMTKTGNNAVSRYANHRDWGNSMLALATASTGEAWNANMHDYMLEYPRCQDNESYLISDCGHETWALGLFSSWNLISMYLMLNVFIAVVVESFGVVWGSKRVTRASMRKFKDVWARFDSQSSGYIKRADIAKFLQALPKPFDVASHTDEYQLGTLVEASRPDVTARPTSRIIAGTKTVIDVGRLQKALQNLKPVEARSRRLVWSQVLYEAENSAIDPRGLAFNDILLILARRKIIDMNHAFDLDELSDRAKLEAEIQDMLNVDRVRSLLRKVYCQRRYKEMLAERRPSHVDTRPDVPSIVVEPIDTDIADASGEPGRAGSLFQLGTPSSPSIWNEVASSAASADGQISPAIADNASQRAARGEIVESRR